MIALKSLATNIQTALNNVSENDTFKIFADMGEFQEYSRAGNNITKYINGVLEVLSPSILPIKSLQAMTQTIRLSLILDVSMLNKDSSGNYIEVAGIRAILEEFMTANNGVPSAMVDADNVTFEITPSFSGVTIGEVSLLSPIGEALPMYLDGVYTFVESGVNSNGVQWSINGYPVFVEKWSLSRVRTAESDQFAIDDTSRTFIQTNGVSVDFNMPFINNSTGGDIEDDLLDGGFNNAQWLQYKRGAKERNYIMVYGTNTGSGEMGKNVGFSVSLVEGKENLLDYNEHWEELTIMAVAGLPVTVGTTIALYNGVCFWGDGKNSSSTNGVFTHTYSVSGTYKIKIYDTYNAKKVTFYSEGAVYKEQLVPYGTLVTMPENPEKENYDFLGWYKDAGYQTPFISTTPVTTNLNLYAKFSRRYIINYNYSGPAEAIAGATTTNPNYYLAEDLPLTLTPATTVSGYDFDGWSLDNVPITTIPVGTTGTLNLVGHFVVHIPVYTIEYYVNSEDRGTLPSNPTSYTASDLPINLLDGIPNEGYYFNKWVLDPSGAGTTITQIPVGMTGNLEIEAQFDAIVNYDIQYTVDSQQGTNNSGNPATYNGTSLPITLLDAIPNEGYRFLYWEDQNRGYQSLRTIERGTTGDQRVEAIFANSTQCGIEARNIDYEDGYYYYGRRLFTASDLPYTIPDPNRSGSGTPAKRFVRWYTLNGGVAETITQVTTFADITIYAEWEDR